MAITLAKGTAPLFSHVTDSSADWSALANNIYFFDLGDQLVHWKDGSGNIIEMFSASGGSSGGSSGGGGGY